MTQASRWHRKSGFVFAAAGSAIGLGNIWSFPVMVHRHGGCTFLFFYLLFVPLVGLPALIGETSLGKFGSPSILESLRKHSSVQLPWYWLGYMSMICCILIPAFYSVVGGWILHYLVQYLSMRGSSLDPLHFSQLTGSPQQSLGWQSIFILISAGIVSCGIQKGIELVSRIMLPILFALLFILVGFAVAKEGMSHTLWSLCVGPPKSGLSALILDALGHSFFTLSVGAGASAIYGFYLPKNQSILKSSMAVMVLDLLASMMIATVVLCFVDPVDNLTPGPGLIFLILPKVFSQMGDWSHRMGICFFLAVALAAITSMISFYEVLCSHLMSYFSLRRKVASLVVIAAVSLPGVLCNFSFNILRNTSFWGADFFGFCVSLTTNFLIPICGIGYSLYFAIFLESESVAIRMLAKFVVPTAVLTVVSAKLLSSIPSS